MTKSLLIALIGAGLISAPGLAASSANTAKAAKTGVSSHAVRPETLSGTIALVDPAQNLVVVQDSSGVPFDLVVSRSTRIKSATGPIGLSDLTSDVNHSASIKFVPEKRGDVAETISVSQ